jgi:hypothetical protein
MHIIPIDLGRFILLITTCNQYQNYDVHFVKKIISHNGPTYVRTRVRTCEQEKKGELLLKTQDAIGGSGGGSGGGGYGGPSAKDKQQAAQLMQSTETLMKFGFMSMSMTYFSRSLPPGVTRAASLQSLIRCTFFLIFVNQVLLSDMHCSFLLNAYSSCALD